MSKRDDFQKTMEDNLALWVARFETIKTKLKTDAPSEDGTEAHKQLDEWQANAAAAGLALDELKITHGDAWDVKKTVLAKAWHDLDTFMAQADLAMRVHDDAAKVPVIAPGRVLGAEASSPPA